MSNTTQYMMEGVSNMLAPAILEQQYDNNMDYIITDYMERLTTRLNILEAELKYAWRALDLLSQEYIKMWERLEKLEGLLYEQQSVIAQLLDFYTTCPNDGYELSEKNAVLDGNLGQLEVIREILGNGTVEDGLEEGVDVTRASSHRSASMIEELEMSLEMNEVQAPDEAFYRSLNQAYRDDLVGCDVSTSPSQLGMIWEEVEDGDDNNMKQNDHNQLDSSVRLIDSQNVFSALDYKDYRGNSPCVSEQDLAQLSRISIIDQIAMEKLDELDRLSNKIQQDSINIKNLQSKLYEDDNEATENGSLDNQIQKIFSNSDMWNFSNQISSTNRPNSRLSLSESVIGTDNEVAETLAAGNRSPSSPRRRHIAVTSCNAPYTTVTGRLAYSTAVQNAEAAAAASNSRNPFYNSAGDLESMMPATYETVTCNSPVVFSIKSERTSSPTISICSVRTRQDGYVGSPSKKSTTTEHAAINPPSSPPPPAPWDICETFLVSQTTMLPESQPAPSPIFISASSETSLMASQDHSRLTPRSPKSPKTSPKRSKSNIVAAKSDSGLSSMSGWSSLEKSPSSPKNGANYKSSTLNYFTDINVGKHNFNISGGSPLPPDNTLHTSSLDIDKQKFKPYSESTADSLIPSISSTLPHNNTILPGGHHMSAFTTVKSPCTLESSGNFVPAPAPASDINVSPRSKSKQQQHNESTAYDDFPAKTNQTAIYTTAGGNNQNTYTTVYTGNTSDYIIHNLNYPDLIEPYESNEMTAFQQPTTFHHQHETTKYAIPQSQYRKRRSLTRTYSTESGPSSEYIASHDCKNAMQRTTLPAGNITDTMCYYPTSSRYDSTVGNSYNDYREHSPWHNSTNGSKSLDGTSTAGIESYENEFEGNAFPERRGSQRHNQQRLYQQIASSVQSADHLMSNNQRQEIPYLELDLKNKNVPEYVIQQHTNQYYDPSNVIMTRAGYITISTDVHSKDKKPSKKLKRGNTLKSAMSSVSHWLPDLHLKKRHRSYSLPSSDRDELPKSTKTSKPESKKKKQNVIMSTVSGILQKAKRHNHNYQRNSLSDPEQSENEWGPGRTSSMISEDEDSYSLASECQSDRDLFPKIYPTKPKSLKQNFNDKIQPVYDESLSDENKTHFEYVSQPSIIESVNNVDNSSTENVLDNLTENDESSKSTDNSLNLFATVGDAKRVPVLSDKSDDSTTSENKSLPQISHCGASMEFAVSRALGKYRQRQSSTTCDENSSISDEQPEKQNSVDDEKENNSQVEIQETNFVEHQKPVENNLTDHSNKQISINGESIVPENSPSALSFRGHINRGFPRHQQSLEIPGYREDDDNRSTHSWRSGSRVSSRRQSTEDSIDSEDEWYCYELRKLEEMEKQSQHDTEISEALQEVPEVEDPYEPDENVKERMSFVLRELRIKAKVVEGVLDEKDNNKHVLHSAKNRTNQEPSLEYSDTLDSEYSEKSELDLVSDDYKYDQRSDEEQSSGDTSGPDSPQMSPNDLQGLLPSFAMCNIKYPTKDDFFPEEAEVIEVIQVEDSVNESVSEGLELPEIKIDTTCSKDEGSKDAGALSSKWKLLKALKERKAEEKSIQGKSPETPGEKVSMLGMMQKFYEVHVKT